MNYNVGMNYNERMNYHVEMNYNERNELQCERITTKE